MAEVIVEEILWTDSAKLSFSNIIDYLNKNLIEREINIFVKQTP
jgi:hypothetical protein